MKHIFLFFLMTLPFMAQALEVDEKLTIRIVKTSETRKTIMINRGTEDGLVEGDHARFIVTAGIVARAVCVRVSPTRSVWSVYRLVNADFIVPDSVMTLKITPPVKITKDRSQSLVEEDVPTRALADPAELGIPLADGARDLNPAQIEGADSDLMSLAEDERAATLVEKNVEVYGIVNISALSASSKAESADESFDSSQSYHHIGLGGEYYPRKEREWYSRFSLLASVNLMRLNNQAYNGSSSTNDLTEFSVGTNWHWKLPSASYDFIPFVHASVSLGTIKSSFKPGSENPGADELATNGATNGFAVGFGYKYYTNRGFGARVLLDYYMRAEKYEEEDVSTNVFTKTVAGPRLMMGLSYRF